MKSYRIVLITLFAFFTFSLNAQVFVGGNFGVNFSGGRNENESTKTDRPSSFGINFSPKIGKFLSDNVAAGLALSFSFDGDNNHAETETIDKNTEIGVAPFLRYYAIKAGKFSAYGQGNLGFSYSRSSTKTGATTNEGPKNTGLSLNIVPGISYDLNDRFSLETSVNVLSFGYYHSTSADGGFKTISSGFNMGAGLSNIITPGNVTIGAIYKF